MVLNNLSWTHGLHIEARCSALSTSVQQNHSPSILLVCTDLT